MRCLFNVAHCVAESHVWPKVIFVLNHISALMEQAKIDWFSSRSMEMEGFFGCFFREVADN